MVAKDNYKAGFVCLDHLQKPLHSGCVRLRLISMQFISWPEIETFVYPGPINVGLAQIQDVKSQVVDFAGGLNRDAIDFSKGWAMACSPLGRGFVAAGT